MFRNQTQSYSLHAKPRADSKFHHLPIYKNEWFSRKIEFSSPVSEKRQKAFHVLALFWHFPLSESKILYIV